MVSANPPSALQLIRAAQNASSASVVRDLRNTVQSHSSFDEEEKAAIERALVVQELKFGTFYTLIDDLLLIDNDTLGDFSNDLQDQEFYRSCCRVPYYQSSERQETAKEKKDRQSKERTDRLAKRTAPGSRATQEERRRLISCRTAGTRTRADFYKITYEAAQDNTLEEAVLEGQSRNSTHDGRTKNAIWKTTVVGLPHEEGDEIAHLVPAAVTAADTYWFVTDFLYGIDPSRGWDETRRLIHGTNTATAAKKPKKKQKQATGKQEVKADKIHHTGTKHLASNKILMSGQKTFLDVVPCVLIVPIMTREQAVIWSGGSYDAIMLIDAWPRREEEEDSLEGFKASLKNVNDRIGFNRESTNPKATPSQLDIAITLLRDYTRAIVFAQSKRKPSDLDFELGDVAGLFYPKLPDDNSVDLNVRVISFEDNRNDVGHPAPDPLLLVSRAVALLQKRHGFNIVDGAEPRDDHFPSEESIEAEEHFLSFRERSQASFNPIGMNIVLDY